ncbi:hypothetical protein EVU94_06020 [Flavobacteriaceae bacterium 144Ye]|nr:hypothetical protein EVU94_06020 [Flavobacteriaceae bacterium 144Ye]
MTSNMGLIKGNNFTDDRGTVHFVNDFSMESVVRLYEISPKDTSIIRAWQAHKEECKWFYCTKGSFKVNVVKIDDFESPSEDLTVNSFELNASHPEVLFIPGGYANGFKAISENSKLMVFSNFGLDASKQDDYRYDTNKWIKNW